LILKQLILFTTKNTVFFLQKWIKYTDSASVRHDDFSYKIQLLLKWHAFVWLYNQYNYYLRFTRSFVLRFAFHKYMMLVCYTFQSTFSKILKTEHPLKTKYYNAVCWSETTWLKYWIFVETCTTTRYIFITRCILYDERILTQRKTRTYEEIITISIVLGFRTDRRA